MALPTSVLSLLASTLLAALLLGCGGGDEKARSTGHGWIARADLNFRDVFVVRDEESSEYLMVGTTNRTLLAEHGQGYFAYRSPDLERWTGPTKVFDPPPDYWAGNDWWAAPEIHEHRGRYYLFGTSRGPQPEKILGTDVLVSDDPAGPFEPLTNGPVTPPDIQCLDGTLWVDGEDQPWLVYSQRYLDPQIGDGKMVAVRLADDLTETVGEPTELFRASDAPWGGGFFRDGEQVNLVTDAPFLYRGASGTLYMLWSGMVENVAYAIGVARSESGEVTGPWVQQKEPLFSGDGGHPMVFHTPDGVPRVAFHAPNAALEERPWFVALEEVGGELRLGGTVDVPDDGPGVGEPDLDGADVTGDFTIAGTIKAGLFPSIELRLIGHFSQTGVILDGTAVVDASFESPVPPILKTDHLDEPAKVAKDGSFEADVTRVVVPDGFTEVLVGDTDASIHISGNVVNSNVIRGVLQITAHSPDIGEGPLDGVDVPVAGEFLALRGVE